MKRKEQELQTYKQSYTDLYNTHQKAIEDLSKADKEIEGRVQ